MKHKMHLFTRISDFHKIAGLPKPEHPLVSVIDYSKVDYQVEGPEISWIQHYYSIGLKRCMPQGKFRYGQQRYDFDEGLLSFIGPGQSMALEIDGHPAVRPTGWLLLIHPDFIWNTTLAKSIRQYDFFGYAVNEALFLSEKEEEIITGILLNIQREYHAGIDKFSQNIIITQVELLLSYSEHFYERQFLTRKKNNHQILERLDMILDDCFRPGNLNVSGLPTAQHIAGQLNISPNYLGSLLKTLTGKTTQGHIHNKLIDLAKEKLSTTELSISEIAYDLGFEHPQSFSKLFKIKTKQSPLAFRQSFS